MKISRRAAVLGALACSCARSGAGASIVGSAARDHWTTKLFGRPAEARLVKRVRGPAPPYSKEPLFRDWQLGMWMQWPIPTRDAVHTEIYEDPSGERIALFTGVPRVDPRSKMWDDKGRLPSGVWQLGYSTLSSFRLFVLPDGATWVMGRGVVSMRLETRFSSDASAPPVSEPKPGALFVQEIANQARGILSSTAILYSDRILGTTVATWPNAPGAPVPVTLDLHFPSDELARESARDLATNIAKSRGSLHGSFGSFLASGVVTSEDERVVVKGTYPLEDIVRWTTF